jgi:hypothetical protein
MREETVAQTRLDPVYIKKSLKGIDLKLGYCN